MAIVFRGCRYLRITASPVQALLSRVEQAQTQLADASRQCLASRKPLVRRSATKAPEIKLLNPRFEEEYAAGKDFDPDRERAAAKQLRRQLQKEKRGAMRELRKDAVFLGEVRISIYMTCVYLALAERCACTKRSAACLLRARSGFAAIIRQAITPRPPPSSIGQTLSCDP